MSDFVPSFNVSWDSAEPVNASPVKQKPKLDAFGVDEAFASYKPSFSTEIKRQNLVMPKPVPPVENIGDTVAARIFSDYCQQKFGFSPDFEQK